MKTFVLIEVTHDKPIAALPDLIAGRAYTINGVENVEAITTGSPTTAKDADGLSAAERAIGARETR